MKQLVEQIDTVIKGFTVNAGKQLADGNKAAGVRARKASLELEKLLKQFRKESINYSGK